MKKRKKQRDWPRYLQKLNQTCELAWEQLEALDEEYQDGADVQLSLRCLRGELLKLRRLAGWLHQTMFVVPVRTMFSAGRINISRQKFYLTRAAGIEMFTAKNLVFLRSMITRSTIIVFTKMRR